VQTTEKAATDFRGFSLTFSKEKNVVTILKPKREPLCRKPHLFLHLPWFTIECLNPVPILEDHPMKLTPGKLAGLKRVSNDRGVIAAAAMDQRGSLQKSLAKEKGSEVSDAMMEEFKSLVAEVLTPHASAILLDPE